ncbi:TniQ family protein [Algiphilus sp.]|uniref:TniQ family protein n=1 Tax=Algiphilus sp. TaxID=1872431 RepID=UPI0032F08F23
MSGPSLNLPPLPGELASSWLFRLAQARGDTPHGLARTIWGNGIAWTRDLDRSLSTHQQHAVANYASVPFSTVVGTTLQFAELRCANGRRAPAVAPGILAVGVYHRRRRLRGQQVCAECLNEDAAPHYRQQWRLSFVFACVHHSCLLLDACRVCGSPISAYRPSHVGLDRCGECGSPLSRGSSTPCNPHALATQRQLLKAWQSDRFCSKPLDLTFAEWLAGLRIMFSASARSNGAPGLWADAHDSCADAKRENPPLELSTTERRTLGLSAIVPLTLDWPTRFLQTVRRHDLTQGMVVHPLRKFAPGWLESTIRTHIRPSAKRKRRAKKCPRSKVSKRKALAHSDASARISERLDRVLGRNDK